MEPSISSVSKTNQEILPNLFKISEFRSNLREILTHIQIFIQQLVTLKSRSNIDLKKLLFQ